MKIKDKKEDFISLTSNKELWEGVLNDSERSGVLTASAALEVMLEKLLKSFLVQNISTSTNIAEKSTFSQKINLCFSLGLITDLERQDLNTLKEIRNAFAHHIFGCDFKNEEVKKYLLALKLPNAIKFPTDNIRTYFNIGMLMLDSALNDRLTQIQPLSQKPNLNYSPGV